MSEKIEVIEPTVDFLTLSVRKDTNLESFISALLSKVYSNSPIGDPSQDQEEMISFACSQALFLLSKKSDAYINDNVGIICDLFDYFFYIGEQRLSVIVAEKLVKQGTIERGDSVFSALCAEDGHEYLKAISDAESLRKILDILVSTSLNSFKESFIHIAVDKYYLNNLSDFSDENSDELLASMNEDNRKFFLKRAVPTNIYILEKISDLEEVLFSTFPDLKRKVSIKEPTYFEITVTQEDLLSDDESYQQENFNVIN